MKYAHYDKTDGKLLGWYDDEIHAEIPSPSVKVSEADWQEAIDSGYNYVDYKTGKLSLKDFRTPEEIQAATTVTGTTPPPPPPSQDLTELNGYKASDFKGRTGTNAAGVKFKSNGVNWVEVK